MEDPKRSFRKKVSVSFLLLVGFLVLFGLVSILGTAGQERATDLSPEQARVSQFGLIAAAAAFSFGALGAGIAIAYVGSAAMGAIGEKPEIAGQALIFIALAEGLVVFGFITALMILGKI
jgi:V/A-type H+-transporting ATPase subunit K